LHEGRCYRIIPSSREYTLATAKAQSMRRSIRRHRKGPAYFTGIVQHQKKQALLQLRKYLNHPVKRYHQSA